MLPPCIHTFNSIPQHLSPQQYTCLHLYFGVLSLLTSVDFAHVNLYTSSSGHTWILKLKVQGDMERQIKQIHIAYTHVKGMPSCCIFAICGLKEIGI